MSLENIYKIIDNISKDENVNAIWISGGEPLIRKDIVEICKYISNKGIAPSISTNGVLLTEKLINDLYRAGIRYIHLSLDGAKAKTHNEMRGVENAFEKLMEVMDLLKKSPINTGASFMVTEDSIGEIDDVLNLAKEKGLSVISFYLVAELGRGAKNFNNEKKEISKKLALKIKSIKKEEFPDLKIEVFRADNMENTENKVLQECKGYNFLNITYDGNLGPCPWFMKSENSFNVGSLLENDFRELKQTCTDKMKKIINNRKNNISYCEDCKNHDICGKGCLALQINSNAKLNKLDPICPRII